MLYIPWKSKTVKNIKTKVPNLGWLKKTRENNSLWWKTIFWMVFGLPGYIHTWIFLSGCWMDEIRGAYNYTIILGFSNSTRTGRCWYGWYEILWNIVFVLHIKLVLKFTILEPCLEESFIFDQFKNCETNMKLLRYQHFFQSTVIVSSFCFFPISLSHYLWLEKAKKTFITRNNPIDKEVVNP